MKKRILYSILNEWRDEDMDDFPLDLDDIDFEVTSPNMDNEPDLGDDEFELSTLHSQYEYFPDARYKLKEIVKMEIEKQGGVHVNLNMINTSKIDEMYELFRGYRSLQTLDISKWDVSSVENMEFMFCGCESLKTLDISKWDVSSVENMGSMFNGCSSLRELDVSKWNVSKVMNMRYMFYYCTSLRSLDVCKWNVSKVVVMDYMFHYCKSLHTDTTMWEINTRKQNNMYDNAPNIKYKK